MLSEKQTSPKTHCSEATCPQKGELVSLRLNPNAFLLPVHILWYYMHTLCSADTLITRKKPQAASETEHRNTASKQTPSANDTIRHNILLKL